MSRREVLPDVGRADLTQGESVLGLDRIPVWQQRELDGNALVAKGGPVLAVFHPPDCRCGRPYGIAYDLYAIGMARSYSVNEVLLHELVHAWQYWLDPLWESDMQQLELKYYGYTDAPHEVEARRVAQRLHETGVQVWFPPL